jgi:hypothetical protein
VRESNYPQGQVLLLVRGQAGCGKAYASPICERKDHKEYNLSFGVADLRRQARNDRHGMTAEPSDADDLTRRLIRHRLRGKKVRDETPGIAFQ